VKNLIKSMNYKTEILRLEPQNDIATQPPSRIMTAIETEFTSNFIYSFNPLRRYL